MIKVFSNWFDSLHEFEDRSTNAAESDLFFYVWDKKRTELVLYV